MNKKLLFIFLLSAGLAVSQVKNIANSELTTGSGVFFAATKNATAITVTLKGPMDRFFAVGFGSGMSSGDALIYSSISLVETLRDHNMSGYTTPSTDAQQDWTLLSNTTASGERTIIASRALNSTDPSDLDFTYAQTTQTLFWAKSSGSSFTISNHGMGNRGAGIVKNWVEDLAPTISSINPMDNSDIVAPTSISITYNEPITPNIGNFSLINDSDNTTQTFDVTNIAQVTISGNTVTMNTGVLASDKAFHVEYPAGIVKDAVSNNVAAMSNATTWNFSTQGTNPPSLTSFSPLDNASNPPVATNLVLTFSEDIMKGTGMIQLLKQPGIVVESFNVASSPLITQPIANQISINPSANLIVNNAYYIVIPSTAISDLTADFYAGTGTDTTLWNFTLSDGVGPIVNSFVPLDETNGILVNSNLTVTFNENIQVGTGEVKIFDISDNLIQTINIASANALISGASLTINPPADLPANTSFYVTIDATAITDGFNQFAGILDNTTWNFNTNDITAPLLLSSAPLDNSLNNNPANNIVLTFNEPIADGTGDFTLNGPLGNQIIASNSPQVLFSGATVTINTTTLPQGNYFLTIPAGTIKDLQGNDFAGILVASDLNFEFGDFVAPTLITPSFIPADEELFFDGTQSLALFFSEPIEAGTGNLIVTDMNNLLTYGTIPTNDASQVSFSGSTVIINNSAFNNLWPVFTYVSVQIEADAFRDVSVNDNYFSGFLDSTTWNFTAYVESIDEKFLRWMEYNHNVVSLVGEQEVEVLSIDGKTIITTSQQQTNLSFLNSGIYIIRNKKNLQLLRIYVD